MLALMFIINSRPCWLLIMLINQSCWSYFHIVHDLSRPCWSCPQKSGWGHRWSWEEVEKLNADWFSNQLVTMMWKWIKPWTRRFWHNETLRVCFDFWNSLFDLVLLAEEILLYLICRSLKQTWESKNAGTSLILTLQKRQTRNMKTKRRLQTWSILTFNLWMFISACSPLYSLLFSL